MKRQKNLASLITTLVFLFLAAGCGKENAETGNEPVITPPPEPITNITDVIRAPDRRALNERPVKFTRVRVQAIVGNVIFWAGPTGEALPIARGDRLLLGPKKTTPVVVGQEVDIVGTVRSFQSVGPNELWAKMWDTSVKPEEKVSLEAAEVFIAADHVNVSY